MAENRKTARRLYEAVDEVIGYCRENDRMLTDFLLTERLGISQKELDGFYADYFSSKDEKSGGRIRPGDIIKKIISYREHYLLQCGLDSSKTASTVNFALRQRKNGGYQEKQAEKGAGGINITVKLDGAGPNPFD